MTREEILTIAKPVLFNTPMVRAVDNGSKTMTRRVVKIPQGFSVIDHNNHSVLVEHDLCPGCVKQIDAPYDVGEYLYVRERYREFSGMVYCWQGGTYIPAYDFSGIEYFADNSMCRTGEGNWGEMFIPSEDIKQDVDYEKWRPSIHMPKEVARTFLQVTGVRAERLQYITEEQAVAEGISRIFDHLTPREYDDWNMRVHLYSELPLEPPQDQQPYTNYLWHGHFGKHGMGNKLSDAWECQSSGYENPILSFSSLWNSTLPLCDWGQYGWNANPWVWVYEFKKLEVQ